MIKIPIAKHIEYCSQRFTLEELSSIANYLDKKLVAMKESLGNGYSSIKEHNAIWKLLVTTFNNLAEGKKAKAFVYQMLVSNEIVDDGYNGKKYCPQRHNGCMVEYSELRKLGREWKDSDEDNICGNLAVCLLLTQNDYFSDFDSSVKFVEIDDSILSKK